MKGLPPKKGKFPFLIILLFTHGGKGGIESYGKVNIYELLNVSKERNSHTFPHS